MIVQILMSICILGILPLCVGLIPVNYLEKQNRSIGVTYLAGTVMILALFQFVTVPVVILDGHGFWTVIIVFSSLAILLTAIGIFITIKNFKSLTQECQAKEYLKLSGIKRISQKFLSTLKNREKREEVFFWLLFVIALAYQLFMALYYTSFDGDDAYYVVQSVLTEETNTLYRIKPYTGLSTGMDLRHALAVFPIWIAYIARMTGIHPTIVAHSLLPMVVIPVVYLVYLQIGKFLLRKEQVKLPIFMVFIAIMQIFGNVSIYTGSTFFLTRTWQGKSLLANFVVPIILWLIVLIFDGDDFAKNSRIWLWVLLVLTNFVAAMSSTGSVFLAAMLIGVIGIVLGILEKKVQIPLRLMISCIPLVLYGAIYLLL